MALWLWIKTGTSTNVYDNSTTKFYKLLDNDITTDIQNSILKYTERMNRDNIINEETKRFLIQMVKQRINSEV